MKKLVIFIFTVVSFLLLPQFINLASAKASNTGNIEIPISTTDFTKPSDFGLDDNEYYLLDQKVQYFQVIYDKDNKSHRKQLDKNLYYYFVKQKNQNMETKNKKKDNNILTDLLSNVTASASAYIKDGDNTGSTTAKCNSNTYTTCEAEAYGTGDSYYTRYYLNVFLRRNDSSDTGRTAKVSTTVIWDIPPKNRDWDLISLGTDSGAKFISNTIKAEQRFDYSATCQKQTKNWLGIWVNKGSSYNCDMPLENKYSDVDKVETITDSYGTQRTWGVYEYSYTDLGTKYFQYSENELILKVNLKNDDIDGTQHKNLDSKTRITYSYIKIEAQKLVIQLQADAKLTDIDYSTWQSTDIFNFYSDYMHMVTYIDLNPSIGGTVGFEGGKPSAGISFTVSPERIKKFDGHRINHIQFQFN